MNNKYKKSRFLYVSQYLDRVTIYYQSINDSFLTIEKKDAQLFNEILDNPSKYASNYPELIQILYNNKFIVNESLNEITDIITRNRVSIFADKHYMLTINPTLNCNLNCWYCTQHSNEKTVLNSEKLLLIKKHISMMAKSGDITGFHLDWFGGEPLLYFNEVIYPLAKHTILESKANNLKFTHHITTNAVLINSEMIKLFKDISLKSFQITVDGYESKHNNVKNVLGEPTYRTVISNINSILNSIPDCQIILRINYEDNSLDGIEPLFDEFPKNKRSHIYIDFQKVWQKRKQVNSENEKLRKIMLYCDKIGYKARYIFYENKPFRTCYADKFFHTVINYDGNIYKCTADDYNNPKGYLDENGRITLFNTSIFNKPTFDNENCLNCNFLSFCYGPCSKKIGNFSETDEFKSICNGNSLEIDLEYYLYYLAVQKKIISPQTP